MPRLMLSFALVFVCSSSKGAEGNVFTELEEIYLAVFTDVIRDYRGSDRVFSVAMSLKNDGNPVQMPDGLWKRLSAMLKRKGVAVSKFVPADEVIWKEEEMHFVHAASQKEVWVYSILGVTWHGTKRLYVSQCKGHGNLAGGGSTLVLEKRRGKWVIIDRIRTWTSFIDKRTLSTESKYRHFHRQIVADRTQQFIGDHVGVPKKDRVSTAEKGGDPVDLSRLEGGGSFPHCA